MSCMYNIEFYETIDGISELWEFLDDLQQKTPRREIDKTKAERDDWVRRMG